MTRVLQISGLPALAGLPSEQRVAAGIDTLAFYSYPLLFYTRFPRVSLTQLRSLSVAGSFLFDHVLCLDALVDRASSPDPGAVLLSSELYREALAGLYVLFPPGSAFWGHFDRYHEQFSRAVLAESSQHRALVHPYEDGEVERIYAGKAAMAKACLAALAVLDGDETALAPLEASHDAFFVGFQLADDLDDWWLDYQRGHYSYPLTRALLSAGWGERVESARRPSITEVGDLLLRTGVVEDTRSMALACFDRAEENLGPMGPGSWRDAIRHNRARIAALRLGPASGGVPEPGAEASAPWSGSAATFAPIARDWRPWLDAGRRAEVGEPAIVHAQQRILNWLGAPTTLGAAVCHAGLAIHASSNELPQHGLAVHLGVSAGELDWFHHHDAWLEALLALAVDDPPAFWTGPPPAPPGGRAGWVPPAVGRYLGHRLVARFLRDRGDATVHPDAVLRHFRREVIA